MVKDLWTTNTWRLISNALVMFIRDSLHIFKKILKDTSQIVRSDLWYERFAGKYAHGTWEHYSVGDGTPLEHFSFCLCMNFQ